MCAPPIMMAVSFGLSAMSQIAAYNQAEAQAEYQHKVALAQAQAQREAIDYQNKINLEAYNAAVQSASKSLDSQTMQENIRVEQEYEAGIHKQVELMKEALRAEGTVLASGENHGLSEEMLLMDIARQRTTYTDVVTENMKKQAVQAYWNKQGMVADAQSRVNANRPNITKQKIVMGGGYTGNSKVALGVGIAGSALDTYSTFHIKKPSAGDIITPKV